MHFIPNIGAFLASIPPVALALFENGTGTALLVALGYAVINTVLGNLVEPALMGRRFGLSTLVVFLSLIFWGWVWGPIGMLLSVPLTIIVKIMLEGSDEWRWLAVLLGPPPGALEPTLPETEETKARTA
jgi:predicted PurR-regulated permease PerM